MADNIPSFLMEKNTPGTFTKDRRRIKQPFIDRGINRVADVIRSGYIQWETASTDGLFQKTDARVKVLFLIFYIVIVSLKEEISSEIWIGCFVLSMVISSGLNVLTFYKRILMIGFLFGFLVALPSAFNLITKGEIIFPVLRLSGDHSFWIYHIPSEIGITEEGLEVVAMLTLRVINSLSVAFLVLNTTAFPEIVKALKVMRVPDGFLMVITLSYKYIFIFARTVEEMYLAKKSRLLGPVENKDARIWAAGRMGAIFEKTRLRGEDIFKAMRGRGFSEEVKLFKPGNIESRDVIMGCILFLTGIFFLII
jgi:cobalt/nickel transport system permease protein